MFGEAALAGLLALALFRARGLAPVAATAGGLLFVFACVLGNTFWPPAVSTILWLPALLLCIEKLAQAWRWRWWAALAGCVALQCLAGFPQYLVYTHYLAAPYALVRLLEARREAGLRAPALAARALGVLLAVALGAGLAAVQILPTAELVGESARGVPLTPERIQFDFFIKPLPLGGVIENALDPRPKFIAPGYGYEHGYLGSSTLVLLAVGLAVGRPAVTLLLLLVAALAFLLSEGFLGIAAPLFELYAKLPTGSTFRDPQRFRVLGFFCVIALAVPGFDAVARGFAPLRGRRAAALAASLGTAALAAAILTQGKPLGTALALATLVLAGVSARFGARPGVAATCGALLLVLLTADLVHATRSATGSFRRVPTAWLTSLHADAYTLLDGERFAHLREELGHARVAFPRLLPSLGLPPVEGDYRVSCMDPLAPGAWSDLHGLLTGRPDSRPLLAKLPAAAFASVYDVTAVHVVGRLERAPPRPGQPRGEKGVEPWRLALEGAGPSPLPPPRLRLDLVANEDALPRAYVVESYAVSTRNAALAHVARGDHDFRRSILLERALAFPPAEDPAPARAAEIVAYAPERVEIEAEARRPGLLVLTDTFFPGWRASVDGSQVEVLRANGLFRAVPLPPGRHRVVFDYAPASLRRGAVLSLASLALLVAVPLIARRRGHA
jgi:hypothetical protein